MLKPYVYVATGTSKDIQRNAPEGVRVAFHGFGSQSLDVIVDPDGSYRVIEGPAPGRSGSDTTTAHGSLNEV